MNVLVTGGLGFIGHRVVQRLESLGHLVAVIDNRTNYGIIPQDQIDYLINERTKYFNRERIFVYGADAADITNSVGLNNIFNIDLPDVVIHLASYPRQKVVNANPAYGSRVMSEGLLNLLETCVNYEVRKFVYVSSSMVYGDFNEQVTEDAICQPRGQYGIMKLAGEWLVKDYSRRDNMVHTIIRPSAVYGPNDVEDRVIAKFMLAAMRNETLKVNGANEALDFTYVDDAANGIVAAALSDNTENKIYNVTRSRSRTLLEAAELIVKIAGRGNIEVLDKDNNFPSRGSLNIDAARKDFEYDPKIDIEEGFQKYYQWLTTTGHWAFKKHD